MDSWDVRKLEYEEAGDNYRFAVNGRLFIFRLFLLFNALVPVAYGYVLVQTPPWFRLLLVLVGVVGFVGNFGFLFLEWRHGSGYRLILRRAVELEDELGIQNGMYQRIDSNEPRRILGVPMRHGVIISIMYGMLAVVWVLGSIVGILVPVRKSSAEEALLKFVSEQRVFQEKMRKDTEATAQRLEGVISISFVKLNDRLGEIQIEVGEHLKMTSELLRRERKREGK